MKKITFLFFLLIVSLGYSQTTSNPVYNGPFGGAIYNQTFTLPTGAESWGGFANNNAAIYPLSFPNAGKVRFKATVSADAEVYFRFEANAHPDVDPSQNTVNVNLLASNAANTEYEVDIPGNATNTYNSAIIYVVTRDVDVNISEIKIEKFDTDGTTVLKTDFPIYDGIFGGAIYNQKFNFPTGAESWAGFANNNTSIYPISFPEGGKVKFNATVPADVEVYFRFEANAHPDVDPSQNTANVTLLASNAANTAYEVDVPGNATNTYNSAIMYIVTRDVDVNISGIKIEAAEATATTTTDLLLGFESSESGGVNEGPFGGMAAPTVMTDGGTNGTEVLKIVGNSATEVWQGINLNLTNNVDLSNTQTMTMDVFSATPITFLVKVNGGINGAPEAAAEVTHNGDSTWQTLSYTFNSVKDGKADAANGQYASFVIHTYWASGANIFDEVTKDERTFFVDNIKGIKAGAAPPVLEPTDAPATPPSFAASNVMSLYSEAYTASASIANVPWDDSVFEEITIAGNKVLKISGDNFIGMDLDSYLDASSMTHLHMDYWIANDLEEGQVMNPKLSNHAAQSGETSAIDITNSISSQAEVKNWQSKDFELNGDRGSIKQFLITQAGRTGLYYLDNVYLYVAGTASVDNNSLLGFSMYPNPANNILNISANGTIEKAEIFNVIGKKVQSFNLNNAKETLDISNLSSGIYLVKYIVDNKVGTAKFIKK